MRDNLCRYKFAAVDLHSSTPSQTELIVCNRMLSKLPCLGNSWTTPQHSFVAIGRDRTVVLWDASGNICDQRIDKTSKVRLLG